MKHLLQKLVATLCLTSLLFVSGCDKLPEGWGKRPYIVVGEKPSFSADEMAQLQEVGRSHPEIARKIIARNNELAEGIATYNRLANKFNRDLLKKIGYSEEEVIRMEPEPRSP